MMGNLYLPPVELAVPFRIDKTGAVATVSDPNAIVEQHVKSILGTNPFERVMEPSYGVELRRHWFEPMEDETELQSLEEQVRAALETWEPNAEFVEVTIDAVPDEATLSVTVKYRNKLFINAPEQAVTVNLNAGS